MRFLRTCCLINPSDMFISWAAKTESFATSIMQVPIHWRSYRWSSKSHHLSLILGKSNFTFSRTNPLHTIKSSNRRVRPCSVCYNNQQIWTRTLTSKKKANVSRLWNRAQSNRRWHAWRARRPRPVSCLYRRPILLWNTLRVDIRHLHRPSVASRHWSIQ